jgi:Arc/MetJ-type ribon-helix-helix transcriptional regulator
LPDKAKIRVSVTMTRPYLHALNRLVKEGVYLSKGEIILEALRLHLRRLKIEPFFSAPTEEAEEPE